MDKLEKWKAKIETIMKLISDVKDEYETVLEEYPDMRDEAGDPGKHEVDEAMRNLEMAKGVFCELKGGSRKLSKRRRTRKGRR
jgi:archaellum component FlaC